MPFLFSRMTRRSHREEHLKNIGSLCLRQSWCFTLRCRLELGSLELAARLVQLFREELIAHSSKFTESQIAMGIAV